MIAEINQVPPWPSCHSRASPPPSSLAAPSQYNYASTYLKKKKKPKENRAQKSGAPFCACTAGQFPSGRVCFSQAGAAVFGHMSGW